MVSIHVVRKRAVGFSNVKSFIIITLELVDYVHRLAVCMGSYGVSEVGARASEPVDGRVKWGRSYIRVYCRIGSQWGWQDYGGRG